MISNLVYGLGGDSSEKVRSSLFEKSLVDTNQINVIDAPNVIADVMTNSQQISMVPMEVIAGIYLFSDILIESIPSIECNYTIIPIDENE